MELNRPTVEIKIRDLEVSYDSTTALTVPQENFEGNVLALIGHNGAGKSTFIKTILGLLIPKKGTLAVHYNGPEASSLSLQPDQHMAFCPEMGSVFSDITVERYIQLWCRLKKSDAKYYRRKDQEELLERLDLTPLMDKLGRELSKGQRRRVQMAIGFFVKPKLFLIDEPFDGLDVQRSHDLTTLISSFAKDMTFIISSHRMDVMERLADFVLVLHRGSFLCSGAVSAVATTLANKTLTLEVTEGEALILKTLIERFPKSVVNKLGGFVTITGNEVEAVELSQIFNIPEQRVIGSIPSLVDAMTYHLKNA